MGSLGGPELIIIALVVLVLFGASGLPKAARSLGRAKVEVDKAKAEYESVIAPVADAKKKFDQTMNASPKQLAKRALTSPAPSTEASAPVGPDAVVDAEIVTPPSAEPRMDQPLPFDTASAEEE